MELRYNYVVLNWVFSTRKIEEDYYYICLKDIEGHDNIIVNHEALQDYAKWLRYLYKLHHYPLINKYIDLPFKSLWNPFVFKNKFKDDKPICFICIRYPSVGYLKFVKKKYPECKIVVMNRDLLRVHRNEYDAYTEAGVYDYWMSYDVEECKKYGFINFDEFESKINVPLVGNYPIADVFFAGRAKDRLNKLVDVYDTLSNKGVKCLFYIVGVPSGKEVKRDGIIYLRKQITYGEMLKLSVNSRCILEINQSDAVGYSSRFLEAVMFNKKLITDNSYIKNSKFYNPRYIQIIEGLNSINTNWVKDEIIVDYHYNNEFSPIHRILQIDTEVLP